LLLKHLFINLFLKKKKKDIHYRYTKGDQKVLLAKSCTASEINEFKLVEGVVNHNIYTLNCTEQDTNGLCNFFYILVIYYFK